MTEAGDPELGSLANVVEGLPSHTSARVWRFTAEPGDVVTLVTDGVGNLIEDVPDFASALASQWQESAPTPAALLFIVDAVVKSYDDDRTIIGVRFGA